MVGSAAGDHGLHAAPPKLAPILVVVVATVGDDAVGTLAWPSALVSEENSPEASQGD
jgi:hypothetical protein